jgi:uncharacterized protein YkwD
VRTLGTAIVTAALAASPAQAASTASTEKAIARCANTARADKGLEPLRIDPALHNVAHRFAKEMARRGFFDHTDPDGDDPGDRIEAAGSFTAWGENIARGYPGTDAACRGWLRSPGHRHNILSPEFTRIGGGYATGGRKGPYFVQDFGTRPSD